MTDRPTPGPETARRGLGWTFVVLGLVQVALGIAELGDGLGATLLSGLGFVLIGGMNVLPPGRRRLRLALGTAGLVAVGAGLVIAFL